MSSAADTAVPVTVPAAVTVERATRWITRALALAWFTIAYNLLEGLASITFGVAEESVALFGFGADSFLEVASAAIVLWRFRAEVGRGHATSIERERRATSAIGALFLLLALATAIGSVLQLWSLRHPSTTVPGLVISSLSLSFMFFLWRAKQRVAVALASRTLAADAACSRACIQLSVVLFAGSLLTLLAPVLWWVDAVAALVLAFLIAREGKEMIDAAREEGFVGGCGCDHGCEP